MQIQFLFTTKQHKKFVYLFSVDFQPTWCSSMVEATGAFYIYLFRNTSQASGEELSEGSMWHSSITLVYKSATKYPQGNKQSCNLKKFWNCCDKSWKKAKVKLQKHRHNALEKGSFSLLVLRTGNQEHSLHFRNEVMETITQRWQLKEGTDILLALQKSLESVHTK